MAAGGSSSSIVHLGGPSASSNAGQGESHPLIARVSDWLRAEGMETLEDLAHAFVSRLEAEEVGLAVAQAWTWAQARVHVSGRNLLPLLCAERKAHRVQQRPQPPKKYEEFGSATKEKAS